MSFFGLGKRSKPSAPSSSGHSTPTSEPNSPLSAHFVSSASSLSLSSSSGKGRIVQPPRDSTFSPSPLPSPSFSSVSFGNSDDSGFAFGSAFARPDSLRVVVVGSGFAAGLSTAIACARQNFSVTLLERSSGLSVHGDSLVLGCNASKILHRWGVGKEMFRRDGSKGGGWEFRDQRGRVLHEEDTSGFEQQYGAPLLQGRRAGFLGSLGVEARLSGVSIRYVSEVTAYEDGDEPAVQLRSGETIRGDVIIVADGVHSPSRDLLAPHDRPPSPKLSSGYSIHRGAVNGDEIRRDKKCAHLLDGRIRTWLGEDSHICTYPMDNGCSLAFTFTHRDSSANATLDWRARRSVQDVLDIIGTGWDPTLLRAIRYFQTVLNWPVLVEMPAEEWISRGGKIYFVGDAIHPMQPTSFQGGSQAIEDAATVALCLAMAGGNEAGVEVALKTFEALRRPRIGEAQKLGKKQQDIWHHYASTSSSSFSSSSSPSSPLRPALVPFPNTPSSRPADVESKHPPSPSSPAAATIHPSPPSLRPLSFSLYAHDAEQFALDHFSFFAAALEPSFRVKKRWVEEAARNAGLEVGGTAGRKTTEGQARR